MKKYFSVADCCFAVMFDERHPFGEHLANYSPFETSDGEAIFTLRFDDSLGIPEDKNELIVGTYDPKEPKVDLYQCPDGYWVEFAPTGLMPSVAGLLMPSDGSPAVLRVLSKDFERFAIDNALMILFAFRTFDLGVLEMHSSVVGYKGKGYMFLGASGTGKSTHSRMWLESFPDAELLNDDNPIIRIINNTVCVFGSPWSGKTPCYKSMQLPIGAIIQIRQAPFNKITALSMPEAYAIVYSSTSGYKADKSIADALHSTIVQTVANVPCYILDCLPDHEAAVLCNKIVSK